MTCALFCRKGRGMASTLAILAAALAAAGLSSCTSGAELTVSASSPQLKQEIARLAADYQRTNGFRITLAGGPSLTRDTAITIGWSFAEPRGGAGFRTIPAAQLQKAGFSTALAFERWALGDAGWREVPILWDAWGIAYPPGTPAPPGEARPFEWKDRGAFSKARQTILAPGGESGARQSLFWVTNNQLPEQDVVTGMLLGGAERSGKASLRYFKSFAAMGKDPILSAGSFSLMKPDVENLARNTRVDLLFGSYEWLRGVPRRGPRDFHALAYPLSQGFALPVSILTGRIKGAGASAAKSADFLVWLLSPENQKELSGRTGYLASNFNAANLDLNAKGAREAAIGAVRIVPVDPEPSKGSAAEAWDSLLGGILVRPTDWERVLAERGNR
jgi:hypothetical protein